jgi:hypothetical protein
MWVLATSRSMRSAAAVDMPLQFVREVGGRLNFRGDELRPLDETNVRAAAKAFRSLGVRHSRDISPDVHQHSRLGNRQW